MNYLGFATWLSIGAAVFCLPYLRWKCPDLPRPIKVNTFIYFMRKLINHSKNAIKTSKFFKLEFPKRS
jgi:hypothetical protein